MTSSPVLKLGSGKAAMAVSPMGYGAMGLTAFYGDAVSDEKGIEILRFVYDSGVRHFDTAQIYQAKQKDGTILYNEDLLGKFLRTLTEEEKKDVTVATKFNPNYSGGLEKFDKNIFLNETEASLKRLGVACIDLYYFHRVYPESKVPVSDYMTAMKELVLQGKVKYVGLSEAPSHIIRKAHAIHPITCIQQEWSLFARDLEESIVPTCKELNIGIIAYSPVGRGFLAGAYSKEVKPDGFKATVPFMSGENFNKNMKLIEEVKKMANEKNCSLSALCLAWVMKQGAVPIPGSKSIEHIKDNMQAVEISLSDEEANRLAEIGAAVSGERGNSAYMSATFQAR